MVSQHALQVVSQHALQQVWGGGGILACRLAGLETHTQGGSLGDLAGGSPGPYPRGNVRGIWPGGSPGPNLRVVSAAGGMHPTGMHSCVGLCV